MFLARNRRRQRGAGPSPPTASLLRAVVAGLAGMMFGAASGATPAALELMGELGCAACHADLPAPSRLRDVTPDLSSAGLRYQPAYLFGYLQRPSRVHAHLGRARMPGFQLSVPETVALVLFLQEQQQIRGQWPPLPDGIDDPLPAPEPAAAMSLLRETGRCLNCHRFDGEGGSVGIELADVAFRLQPEWVRRCLVAPAMYGVDPGIMPPPFFERNEEGTRFEPLTHQATEAIGAITAFLFARHADRRDLQEAQWRQARADHAGVTAAQGERLFTALNCAACHRHHRVEPRAAPAAPPLLTAGTRLREDWLESYLRNPVPVRPFGFQPGHGSRMPDFRLDAEEVSLLAGYLSGARTNSLPPFEVKAPSAFAMRKADMLLRNTLSCLGCHALNGEGGRIAPDLAMAGLRLRPDYLRQMIRDPQFVAPHTIMPRPFLTEITGDLLANVLLHQHRDARAPVTYLSPLDHTPLPEGNAADTSAGQVYLTHCAACHGVAGRGDGFNAPFLPVKPTPHADPVLMGRRPDDTLYDGIHAGGAILNRHHRMPAWGGALSPGIIRGLVAHVRALCGCEQPDWAGDPP